MTQYCSHHPTRPAHFHCPKCNADFCASCITKKERDRHHGSETLYLCPKCMVPAEWTGADNLIEPFWHRLPKFFAYPFASRPFLLIVLLAIAGIVFAGAGLFNLFMRILLYGVLLKYSYAALQATARGDLVPPEINKKTISEDFLQVFKQTLLFVLAFGVGFVFVSATFGPITGILYLILIILALPAMIIILVTTDSLLHAMNPLLFGQLAIRIGWGYLLMYFFLILLGVAPMALGRFAGNFLPAGLVQFVFGLATNYYTIISYHLMGYVILQYHREIGHRIEFEDFRYESDPSEGKQDTQVNSQAIEQINFLLKEGKHDEALEFIQEEIAGGPVTDIALSGYYFKLLKMKNRKSAMADHGKTHLNLLIGAGQKKDACEIYVECLKADPSFTPEATVLFKLAGWLNEYGKSKEAIGTFNRLIKSYPDDSLVPNALFRAAQIYNDRLMNPEKAKKILQTVLKKYPHHDFVPQIKNYLSHM